MIWKIISKRLPPSGSQKEKKTRLVLIRYQFQTNVTFIFRLWGHNAMKNRKQFPDIDLERYGLSTKFMIALNRIFDNLYQQMNLFSKFFFPCSYNFPFITLMNNQNNSKIWDFSFIKITSSNSQKQESTKQKLFKMIESENYNKIENFAKTYNRNELVSWFVIA